MGLLDTAFKIGGAALGGPLGAAFGGTAGGTLQDMAKGLLQSGGGDSVGSGNAGAAATSDPLTRMLKDAMKMMGGPGSTDLAVG